MPTAARSALAHLYRRAGFGARPEQLDAAERAGYAATVARLLDFGAADPAAAAVTPPQLSLVSQQGGKDASPRAREQARRQAREQGTRLTLWWLRRMAAADNPLREKLTLFWHGHSPPRSRRSASRASCTSRTSCSGPPAPGRSKRSPWRSPATRRC
jgi:uncharacterized protein (DUF1800 family)